MSEHKFDPSTAELSGYLYELALSIKAAGQNAAALEAAAERLDAQTVIINGQSDVIERLRKAMEDIKRHQELVGGTMGKAGATWHIANKALKGGV